MMLYEELLRNVKGSCNVMRKIIGIGQKLFGSRILLIVYTILLFAAMCYFVNDNCFWGDECFSIRLSQMSFAEMLHATAQDVHPPLYYVFVIIGQRLCGTSGVMYHIVSIIPCALVMIFANTSLYKHFGFGSTLLFVTLCSALPRALEFSAEVRMYSWACFFVLMAFWYVYKILMNDTLRNYLLFSIFSLLAAYTHYYALLSVAFFYIAIMIVAVVKKRNIRNVVFTWVITILAYIPWLSTLLTTFVRTKDGWWVDYTESAIDCLKFFFDFGNSHISIALLTLCILLTAYYALKKRDEIALWTIIGLAAAALTLVTGQALSYLIRPLFLDRYLYPVCSVVWVILSVMAVKTKKVFPYLLVFVVFVCSARKDKELFFNNYMYNKLCAETVDDVSRVIDDESCILTNDSLLNWTVLDYYFPGLSHSTKMDNLDENKKYYLVWGGREISDDSKKQLEKQGFAVEKIHENGMIGTTGVQVYELKTD